MLYVILYTGYKDWFPGGRCCSAEVCEYLHYSTERCAEPLSPGAPQFIVGQLSDDPSHELNLHAGIILGVIEHDPWKRRAVNYRSIVKLRAVLNWLRLRYTD